MIRKDEGGFYENLANAAIGRWLNTIGRKWRATAERTGRIEGSSKRPDIIITEGDRMPVIIECEWESPAVGDAIKRLGKN